MSMPGGIPTHLRGEGEVMMLFEVDQTQPTTTVQVRLANETWMPCWMNLAYGQRRSQLYHCVRHWADWMTGADDCRLVAAQARCIILAPCSKTINANGVAQLFFDYIFKRFGLYNSIISDRGRQFASAFARELARILK